MRIRKSTSEFCYSRGEFKALSAAAICRRMGIGEEWVDREADERAQRAKAKVQAQATA